MYNLVWAFSVILSWRVLAVSDPAASSVETASSATRRLTLQESITLALEQNPDILSADAERDAAEASRASARGMFGPKVRAEAGLQRWQKPLSFSFNIPPFELYPGMAPLDINLPPMVVRNKLTWSASATVVQPILSMWTIFEAYHVRDLGVDVAGIRQKVARNDIVYQTTEAYYRLLQATELEKVAQKSVDLVNQQVQRAESFFKHQMVGENDVLRAKLGLASVTQRLIQARGAKELAKGQLAMVLGLPLSTEIEPIDVVTEQQPNLELSDEQVEEQAVVKRVEIQELAARTKQANTGVRLAWSRMLPQVNALANYTHTEGSKFAQKDAWFIGGNVSWDVWEWGSTYYGINEAKARAAQALAAKQKVENMIRLQSRAAWVTYMTAAEAMEVAKRAVAQAEENFRIEQKRYDASSNTTFDVLDAETQLTAARFQYQTSLYDFHIAQVGLKKAMGEELFVSEKSE